MAKKLGEKIRDLRRANNLSQEALASTLGVTFQAVSKWENSTAMPDVGLIPAIAHFFGISIDELFDYNTYENEQSIDKLCREAAACRYRDPGHAEALLRDGLKPFPGNETILTVLMFVLQSVPAREEELIETCRQLIDRTTNEGVRYDALRTLAEAYFYTNRADRVGPVLAQIPEFYFTKLECRQIDGGAEQPGSRSIPDESQRQKPGRNAEDHVGRLWKTAGSGKVCAVYQAEPGRA